jgi:hypothetical protein
LNFRKISLYSYKELSFHMLSQRQLAFLVGHLH